MYDKYYYKMKGAQAKFNNNGLIAIHFNAIYVLFIFFLSFHFCTSRAELFV